MSQPILRSIHVASILLIGLVLMGCRPQEQIRQYKVPKEQVAQRADDGPGPAREAATSPGAAPGETAPNNARMLAALVTRPDTVWSFKLVGPVDKVSTLKETFRELIASITFGKDGRPTWMRPDGWKHLPPSGMRLATIQPDPEDPKLEISVIGLPTPQELLGNVNRWREQLSLPAITGSELPGMTEEIPLPEGDAVIVDLEGHINAAQPMGPFMTQGGSGSPGPAPPELPPGHPPLEPSTSPPQATGDN